MTARVPARLILNPRLIADAVQRGAQDAALPQYFRARVVVGRRRPDLAERNGAARARQVAAGEVAQLADLMIDHGVGVTTEATYELKRIDLDYFSEE